MPCLKCRSRDKTLIALSPGRSKTFRPQEAALSKLTKFVSIALFGISLCFSQVNRGTFTGVITDPSGAVVPGVKIAAIHVETGTSSTTLASESGSYTIPALQIGLYRIEFEAPGFKKGIRN